MDIDLIITSFPKLLGGALITLKLISYDCKNCKIIDDIIPEPYGGDNRHTFKQAEIWKINIVNLIDELNKISIKELVELRKEKYLNITSDI